MKEIDGAILRSRLPRCPADAGLIRSAARPPYGELPGYARTRVSRRSAYSVPPNKTLDRSSLRLHKTFGFSQARATGQLTVPEALRASGTPGWAERDYSLARWLALGNNRLEQKALRVSAQPGVIRIRPTVVSGGYSEKERFITHSIRSRKVSSSAVSTKDLAASQTSDLDVLFEDIEEIISLVEVMPIWRPFHILQQLHKLRVRLKRIRSNIKIFLNANNAKIMAINPKTMGEVLISTETKLILFIQSQQLQNLLIHLNAIVDNKHTLSLAIIAVYLSIFSIIITIVQSYV
jgi:hypothetical protein